MRLTPKEARSIIFDDNDEWEEIEQNIVDTSRWSIHKEGIFLNKKENKHYLFEWSVGATECQDELPYEYDEEVIPKEMKQTQKTIWIWEPVNEKDRVE